MARKIRKKIIIKKKIRIIQQMDKNVSTLKATLVKTLRTICYESNCSIDLIKT